MFNGIILNQHKEAKRDRFCGASLFNIQRSTSLKNQHRNFHFYFGSLTVGFKAKNSESPFRCFKHGAFSHNVIAIDLCYCYYTNHLNASNLCSLLSIVCGWRRPGLTQCFYHAKRKSVEIIAQPSAVPPIPV